MKQCKCSNKSDFFDILSQTFFCSSCYQNALTGNFLFLKYPHVKKRLKQRYNIDLTVYLYREMLRQIQDENLHTYDENSSKYLNGNKLAKKNLERHLVFIEGQVVLTIYLNIKNPLDAFILTALPIKNLAEAKTKGLKR